MRENLDIHELSLAIWTLLPIFFYKLALSMRASIDGVYLS
jgi:hypothetical protein